ncbi:MAG: sigma-70 family RNA polymerase sigma factor [Planctomycetota bacterium]
MQITDSEIIKRCLQGDKDAFGMLVERYQGLVYTSAFAYLRNTEDARDITQEIFIRAYTSLGSLKKPGKFGAWLSKISSRLCIDKLRSKKKTLQISQFPALSEDVISELSPEKLTHEEKMQLMRKFQQVLKAIDQLPEYHRVAFILKYMEDLSVKEISRFLDIPESTIEGRLHKSRAYIREKLQGLDK